LTWRRPGSRSRGPTRPAAPGPSGHPGPDEPTTPTRNPVPGSFGPERPTIPTRGPGSRPRVRPTGATTLRAAGAVVVLAGCLLLGGCQRPAAQPGPGEAAPSSRAAAGPVAAGRPVSIAIPAARVDARVVPVGLRPDRTMEVPGVDLAGWYELGPRPGEAGPAVIVGHVDSGRGPAVFFRLGQLQPGDRIEVGLEAGAARSFVVERVERRPKSALPVERIWSPTGRPVLRLITCGGAFDRSSGHYRDNVIVYARATT
jgi:Sortase domain